MDEVSRKEYLRKNRRRPVDQIVNELGEGRGMDRQRTREQLLADAEGNADISQESPRPATRSAERSASRRTTASMCRSRLLRRYVSYTQPPIPIFSIVQRTQSPGSISELNPEHHKLIRCALRVRLCAHIAYSTGRTNASAARPQTAARDQRLEYDECSSQSNGRVQGVRRQQNPRHSFLRTCGSHLLNFFVCNQGSSL